MPASAALPAAAREHAWHLLWQRLLTPLPDEEADPVEADQVDEERADDEAA